MHCISRRLVIPDRIVSFAALICSIVALPAFAETPVAGIKLAQATVFGGSLAAPGSDDKSPGDAVPPQYPPSGGGKSASGSFQATPPADDDPNDAPDPLPPMPDDDSDRQPSSRSSRTASPERRTSSVQAEPAAPERRRPPAAGTSLIGSMPTFDFDPAPADADEPAAALLQGVESEFLVATADIEQAQLLAVSLPEFRLLSRSTLSGIGVVVSKFGVPAGINVFQAVDLVRAEFQDIIIAADVNHLYTMQGRGRTYAVRMIGWDGAAPCASKTRIGMIDTPVDASAPVLASSHIDTVEILPAGLPMPDAAHGTAVAAILAGGEQGNFKGLYPAGEIVAVNVFRKVDEDRVDSTAEWLVRGIDALVGQAVGVINVSLGGADNQIVALAVRAVLARGIAMVAAAGNGGVGAPPVYPAAYPGVIAVTAVDADARVYRHANRGEYIDFSAPGVDVFVALDGRGSYLSGTSYATPFITAAVGAIKAQRGDLSTQAVIDYLASLSRDLGDAGRDATYGFGLPDLSSHCAAIARLATQ